MQEYQYINSFIIQDLNNLLVKSMIQVEVKFSFNHSLSTKIQYFYLMLDQLELSNQLSQLTSCKSQQEKLDMLKQQFCDQNSGLVSQKYIDNFAIILGVKVIRLLINKKTCQEQMQLKKFQQKYILCDFKELHKEHIDFNLIRAKIQNLFEKYKTKKTLSEHIKLICQGKDQFYNMLLIVYYYYFKEILVDRYQFEAVSKIQKHLMMIKGIYNLFFLDYCKELRYLSRKQPLNVIVDKETTIEIIKAISDKSINSKIRICLSQVLRNIIQNGLECSVQDLIEIAENEVIKQIKQSIYQGIIYCQNTDQKAKQFIDQAIQVNENIENNHYLIQKRIMYDINKQQKDGSKKRQFRCLPQKNINCFKNTQNYSFRNKLKAKHIQSFQNLQLTKQLKRQAVREQNIDKQKQSAITHPQIILKNQKQGNDRSILRRTFAEIQHLFMVAQTSGQLKKQDKDQYIYGLFIKKDESGFSRVLIDIMIAKIYSIISKKQKLTQQTIINLIEKCVKTSQNFRNLFLININLLKEISSINIDKYTIREYDQKTPIKKFMIQIFNKNLREEQKIVVINQQIDVIRVDAITAIYHALLADIKKLELFNKIKDMLFKSFQQYLNQSLKIGQKHIDSQFFQFIIKICSLKGSKYFEEKHQNWKNLLFKVCILELSYVKSKKMVLEYMKQIVGNITQHPFLFKDKQIQDITKCICNQKEKGSLKILMNIIISYLLNKAHRPIKIDIFMKLKENGNFQFIKVQYYTGFYLSSQKQNFLATEVIDWLSRHQTVKSLIDQFQKYNSSEDIQDQNLTHIILLILQNLSKCLYINQLNIFSNMILDHTTFAMSNNELVFLNYSQDEENDFLISEVVASILYNSICKGKGNQKINLNKDTLHSIFEELKRGNLRTRLLLSKILSMLSETEDLTSYFANLEQHFDEQIFQIKFYIIKTYLNISKKQVQQQPFSFNPNQLHSILIQQEIYLDNKLISEDINNQLLGLLQKYTKYQMFKEFTQKKIFNIIIHFLRKQQKLVQICIQILITYSSKYWVPKDVLQAVDRFFLQKPFNEQTMDKLEKQKQKIYQNLIKNEQQITMHQINLWIDRLLNCNQINQGNIYFQKLNKISKNQDLPQSIFNIIELERCCNKLNKDSKNPIIQEKIVRMTEKGFKLNDSLNFSKMKDRINAQSTNIIKILYYLSLNQLIPMSTIDKLLTIYQPSKNQNIENQKLIAKIIVNTYLNYQINEILSKDIIWEQSINNQQLLQITLPIILKQDFTQEGQKITNALKKLIQFYQKTNEARHKQSICLLFSNENIIKKLKRSQIQLFKILTLQYQSQKIKQNCLKGLDILGKNGSKEAKEYLKNNKLKLEQEIKIQIKTQRSQIFQKCNNLSQKLKQHKNQTTFISKLIQKIIFGDKKDEQQQQQKKKEIIFKADYLYSAKELLLIKKQFQRLYQKGSQQNCQITHQTESNFLEIIIIASSIHQSHIFQQMFINSKYFVLFIEKKLRKNYINVEILRIYSKVIQLKSCIMPQQIFLKIIQFLTTNHQLAISLNLLLVLQKFIIFYKEEIITRLNKQNEIILKQFLSNKLTSNLKIDRFISIKCLKMLYQQQQVNKLQILRKKIEENYSNFQQNDVKDYLEVLAILNSKDMSQLNEKASIKQIVCSLILKNLIFEVTVDDLQRIKLNSLWQEQSQKISNQQKLEILSFLYVNANTNFTNIYSFIKYFLFNSSFINDRKKLLRDISSHQFEEKSLIKTIVHHYIQLFDNKLSLEPEIILHITYGQQIQNIYKFLQPLKKMQKKQAQFVIQTIYQNDTSLKNLFQNIDVLNLHNIQAFYLLNQIIKNKVIISITQNQKLKKLIHINLYQYTFDTLTRLFQLIIKKLKQFGQKQLKCVFFIEFLELITHFSNYTKSILQSTKNAFQKCEKKADLLFQKLNQIYVNKKAPIKDYIKTKQCINKTKIYPQAQQSIYKAKRQEQQKQLQFIKNNQYHNKFLDQKFRPPKKISKWQDQHFKTWASQVKKHKEYSQKSQFIKQALMIIQGAIYGENANTNKFRDNQLISCLMMLKDYQANKKNKLLQISTGQGKSIIICAVAIVLVLKGHKIDIVTTTSILAERDAKYFQSIYKKFLIKVSDNIDRDPYLDKPKKCYSSDVVYGEISQFQFDYLRDQYNGYNTLGERKKTYVIVDEVDAMLIDDSSKIAKISSNIAGMDKLQIIYVLIWQRLLKIKENIIEFNDQSFYLDGRIEIVQGIIGFQYIGSNNELVQINDIKRHIENTYRNGDKLNNKIINLQNSTQQIKSLLMAVKEQIEVDKIHIPVNFKDFVERQFPRWVDSALQAYDHQQNINYIIQNDTVSPVDYDNTGKIQHSTHWANGLHQFLQIKHFLKITPQNLTTNFISNIKYFKLYENIVGVTGTLGSQKCKNTLSKTYNADVIIISDSFQKQLVDYPIILSSNTDEWMQRIKQSVQYQLHKNRGILIIGQTIEYCNYFAYYLSDTKAHKIILYTMNDKDQEKGIRQIKDKQIIIATNLAGRGTDISAAKIEQFGGLHVIITFLPKNLRVQDQVKGRTARNGSQGSWQMVINKLQLPIQYHQNYQNIFQVRDKLQQDKLDNFIKQEQPEIQRKDALFQKFCIFLKKTKKNLQDKLANSFRQQKKLQKQIVIPRLNKYNSSILQNVVLAIEQRWAFYLNKNTNREQGQSFDDFTNKIKIDNYSKIIKNPYYLTLIGYDLLNSKLHFKNFIRYVTGQDIFKAKFYLQNAIQLDERVTAAWVGMGELCLQLKNSEQIKILCQQKLGRKDRTYKQLATYYYQQAVKLLKKQIKVIATIQQYSAIDESKRKSLFQQTFDKYQILMQYLKNIMNILLQIKKSKKLITITKRYGEQIMCYRQIERKEDIIHEILKKQQPYQSIEITFHHLNSNQQNQSIKILDHLEQIVPKINLGIDIINIQLKQVSGDQINQYLLNSKIKKAVGHKQALKLIKKQKSDELTKFIITSKLQKRTEQSNRSESLEYLNANEFLNDTYDITISHPSQSSINYTQGLKLTIKSCNLTHQHVEILITTISSAEYQISIGRNKNISFQRLQQFIQKHNFQKKIFLGKTIKEESIFICQSNCLIHSTTQAQFSKQNYQNCNINKISFRLIDVKDILIIVKQFSDQFFTISFINCNKVKLFKNTQNIKFNLLFHSFLNKQKIGLSKKLLKDIEKKKKDNTFDLIIKNLNKQQIQQLSLIQLSTQDIIIKGKKQICQLFPKAKAPFNQIYLYMLQGIQYILVAQQKKSIPFATLLALGTISTVQMVTGILLMGSGFGAIWGISLIMESLVDMTTTFTVAITGQFSWGVYGVTKALSIALILFFGVNALGVVGASLLSVAKANGIKFTSQTIMNHKNVSDFIKKHTNKIKEQMPQNNNNKDDFQYRKIIYQTIFKAVVKYFTQNTTARDIISKMMMLDCIQQSKLWERKLQRNIKLIVHSESEDMQLTIQKFAKKISEKISSGQVVSDFQQLIKIRNNKYLSQIINCKCQQFEIKIHENQSSMLKLNQIFKKYSSCQEKVIISIYQSLKKSDQFVKTFTFDKDGKKSESKYEVLNQNAIQNGLKIDPKNELLQKCKLYKSKQNQDAMMMNICRMISQEISNLLVSKFLEQIANPLLKNNSAYSSKNIRESLNIERLSVNLQRKSYFDPFLQKYPQIQHNLVFSQDKIQQNLKKYSEMVRKKPANPIDILILIQEFHIKAKFIKAEHFQPNIVAEQPIIQYKKNQDDGRYQYSLRYIQRHEQPQKNQMDQGFYQISTLLKNKISIFMIRKEYSKIIIRKSQKFLNYFKNYYRLYSLTNEVIKNKELSQRWISFKQLTNNYLICSLLQKIKRLQKCIMEHILIKGQIKDKEKVQHAFINLTYKQPFKEDFSNLIQFILKKNVQAQFVKNNQQKVTICQDTQLETFRKIQIKVQLDPIQ